MEVQTFFLCTRLEQPDKKEDIYHCQRVGLNSFYPLDGVFPIRFSFPYYMLIRRESRDFDEEVTLRLNCVDIDGRILPVPGNIFIKGSLLKGSLFADLTGSISFEIPKAGIYRIDITADENKIPSVYNYTIEVHNQKAVAPPGPHKEIGTP